MKLAVGFFDGVHAGHRRILAQADAALTFRNHPATVLAPDRVPGLLMTVEDRLAALTAVVGARVKALEFTPELAAESPDAFVSWLRMAYPTCETIICGPNWRFGARGAGTADFLQAQGFKVEVPAFAEWEGKPVSSTRIRAALAEGAMAEATAMLGRPWAVTGCIQSGKGLGRKLGFPTLNLQLPDGLVSPPFGVYALQTPLGAALANWGLAPTLRDQAWKRPVLEVHILPASSPTELMYQIHQFTQSQNVLRVEWLKFIRPERTFASLDELKEQIARDIDSALCSEHRNDA